MSPLWTYPGAFARKKGSHDPWFSNGQTDIVHYSGAAAEELYLTGVPASGNITGSIAGNVLTAVTSPWYRADLRHESSSLASGITYTNVTGCSVVGGVVTKTAITGWYNAEFQSAERILSGSLGAGGYVEFTINNLATRGGIGLASPPSTSVGYYHEIDYFTYQNSTGLISYELSASTGSVGASGEVQVGSVARIAVSAAGVVSYWLDGKLKRVSPTIAPETLEVDSAFYDNGASFTDVKIYQRSSALLPIGVGFDNNSADSFDGADNDVHNFGTGAFAILLPCAITGSNSAYRIAGKEQSLSTGWHFRHLSGTLYFPLTGSLGATSGTYLLGYTPGDLIAPLLWRSVTGGTCGITEPSLGEGTDSTAIGDLTVARKFSLGSVDARNACECRIGPVVIWTGAAAETVIANRATWLPAWRTATGVF